MNRLARIAAAGTLAAVLAACSGNTTATRTDAGPTPTPTTSTPSAWDIEQEAVAEEEAAGVDADASETPEEEVPEELEPAVGKIGESFNITGTDYDDDLNELEFSGIVKAESIKVIQPGEWDDDPEYDRYLRVVISAESTDGKWTINPYDFQMVAPDGTTFDGDAFVDDPGAPPDLNDTTVRKGRKAKGSIHFDIPKGKGLELHFNPDDDESIAVWHLPRIK